MEKASTPRNRLTRSAAKQVKTPKSFNSEESVGKNTPDDIKHGVRKTRRKYDSKTSTNGDTGLENKEGNEDTFKQNIDDGFEQDDVNMNDAIKDSPESINDDTPLSLISRRSLRPRRSITPGPELESNISKPLRRSTSQGILESATTPTNRRGRRATSESKDFVFTPSKEQKNSLNESNCKYIPLTNASLRTIDKIDEVNEIELLSDNERDIEKEGKTSQISRELEDSTKQGTLNNKSTGYQETATKSEVEYIENSNVKEEVDPSGDTKTDVNDSVVQNDLLLEKVKNGRIQEDTKMEVNDSMIQNDLLSQKHEIEGIPEDTKMEVNDSMIQNGLLSQKNEIEGIPEDTKMEVNDSMIKNDLLSQKNEIEGIPGDTKEEANDSIIQNHLTSQTVVAERSPVNTNKMELNDNLIQNDALFLQNDDPERKPENTKIDVNDSVIQNDLLLQEVEVERTPGDPKMESNDSVIKEDLLFQKDEVERTSDVVIINTDETKLDNNGDQSIEAKEVISKTTNEDNKLEQESCFMTSRVSESQDTDIILGIGPETRLPDEETCKPIELQSLSKGGGIVTKNREIDVEEGVINVSVEENNAYSSSESENVIKINENISNNAMETDNKFEDASIEITLDDNESQESFEQLKTEPQNKSILKIYEKVDTNLTQKDTYNDYSENKIINEGSIKGVISPTENGHEDDKIELINSSDSEDYISEEKHNKDNERANTPIAESIKDDVGKLEIKEAFVPEREGSVFDCNVQEEGNVTDSIGESTNFITNNSEIVPDQYRGEQHETDIIEDKSNNDQELYFIDAEPAKSYNIAIENPHTLATDDLDQCNTPSNDQETNMKNSLVEGKCLTFKPDENTFKHEETNEEENNARSLDRLNEVELNQTDQGEKNNTEIIKDDTKVQDENDYGNFNENYEDLNKSDEDSCDIYKGLSEDGSYDGEMEEGSQFGESVSSELHSGTDNSEEYVTSVDEEDENINEKNEPEKEPFAVPNNLRNKELILSKEGQKPPVQISDSPMTYDKALAIINKNRVKKIDDEEFFDMFTQELNKVSDKSGSDSDIAIVDEYLMEPEEATKKQQQKLGNAQVNAKQPPRPTDPTLTNDHYTGGFNQQVQAQHGSANNQHNQLMQHSHPGMQRMNFPQGAMYRQYNQNMQVRGQLMYNQYAGPNNLQDPHMFNSHVPPDVNFSRASMFNHFPTSIINTPFHANTSPLKVRSINDMSNSQSLAHEQQTYSDQGPSNLGLDERYNYDYDNRANAVGPLEATEYEQLGDMGADNPVRPNEFLTEKVDKSRTPILDLLGLDEKALTLLKSALGLNAIKRKVKKHDLVWKKKCLERNMWKSEMRQSGRKTVSRLRNSKRKYISENDSSSTKSSTEQSSEGSSISSGGFSRESNDESSSENGNREVNIEKGSCLVKLNTKPKPKPRQRNKKEYQLYQHFKKTRLIPTISSLESSNSQRNPTFSDKKNKRDVFRSSEIEFNSKKMAQKQSAVIKSQCGTFTVDSLTASSDSEAQFIDNHKQELKRKMKSDLSSGKNKLSNLFTQYSFKRTKRDSVKKVSKPENDEVPSIKKKNLKELKKLPSKILETLANEEKKKKRHRKMDSGSDQDLERPKKIKKGNQKLKIKSTAPDQSYIPFVTASATQFGLNRLDKDGSLTLAEKATKFRTDQLYGGSVKRITILDFKHQWC